MIDIGNYIIRISKSTSIHHIYWNRIYYAKLRRNWNYGSKLLFLTKTETSDEVFIGLGKIEMIYEILESDISEKKICAENNYHSKIVFGTMLRFIPAVLIKDAQSRSLGRMSGPLLDGAQISDSEISKIEQLVNILIIM